MPNIVVSSTVHTFMQASTQSAARTAIGVPGGTIIQGARQTASNSTGDTTLAASAALVSDSTAVVTFTGAARTSAVAIPITNRVAGDRFAVKCLLPATPSIVVNITNNTTGGTLLYTITTDSTGDQATFEVEYDGAAWQKFRYNYPS